MRCFSASLPGSPLSVWHMGEIENIAAWHRHHFDSESGKRLDVLFRELDVLYCKQGWCDMGEYQCKQCPKAFDDKMAFASHVQHSHPKRKVGRPSNKSPGASPALSRMTCPTCGTACLLVPIKN